MSHPIYGVVSFEIQAPYTLRVCFDDGTDQVIDFQPLLDGTSLLKTNNTSMIPVS